MMNRELSLKKGKGTKQTQSLWVVAVLGAVLCASFVPVATAAENTTAAPFVPPSESVPGELKAGIIAGGWIPFSIVLVLSFLFSFAYVRYYQHSREREASSTIVAVLGLTMALLTTALVPVDIFLVSAFKDSDGTFHSWASDDVRTQIKNTITDSYYAMYALNCFFVFLAMPMAYFYFEEKDEVSKTTSRARCLTALKFTSASLVVFAILMCIGAFALNSDGSSCNTTNSSSDIKDDVKCRAIFAEESLSKNGGTNAISFTIGCLAVIGMGYFAFYTALGLVSLPASLWQTQQRTSDLDLNENMSRVRLARDKQDSLRNKYANKQRGRMTDRDRDQLADQEEEERLLTSAQNEIVANEKTCLFKISRCCAPFGKVFAILFFCVSLFIVIALMLGSIDRLTQIVSQGLNWKTGYSEASPRLINPVDKMLTVFQKAFPVDYITLTLLTFYLVLSTASGIVQMGIRFCFMKVFSVRVGKTVPQGILCLVSVLVFVILALNIVLLTLAPQYTTYGNQQYQIVEKGDTFAAWPGTATTLCDSSAPENVFYVYNSTTKFLTAQDYSLSNGIQYACRDITIHNNITNTSLSLARMGCAKVTACESTRLTALLHAFFYNAWFFGAIYFWTNWIFIVVFFIGIVFFAVRRRSTALEERIRDRKTNFDDDDDIVQFNPKWLRGQ